MKVLAAAAAVDDDDDDACLLACWCPSRMSMTLDGRWRRRWLRSLNSDAQILPQMWQWGLDAGMLVTICQRCDELLPFGRSWWSKAAEPSSHVYRHASQSYGASLAMWDHTVLPATWHKWTRPALTPARQAGIRFTYPRGMEGCVDLGSLIAARPGIEPMTAWSQVLTVMPPSQPQSPSSNITWHNQWHLYVRHVQSK